MRDIAAQLLEWHEAGRDYALASVIGVGGCAPCPVGTAMAVAADGTVIGNVSGGVVEGAVSELCRESLRTGRSVRESFGYLASDARGIGSTRGATIQVFVQSVTEANRDAVDKVLRAEGEAVALVRDLDSGAVMALGTWWESGAELDEKVVAQAAAMLDAGQTAVRAVDCTDAEAVIFVECHVPQPRQCFLTRDAKSEAPLLEAASRLPVASAGAMGSRRGHAGRLQRLRAVGRSAAELARLRSPIGLDLFTLLRPKKEPRQCL